MSLQNVVFFRLVWRCLRTYLISLVCAKGVKLNSQTMKQVASFALGILDEGFFLFSLTFFLTVAKINIGKF